MAGENRGKAVEAIARLAVSQITGHAIPKGTLIVWDTPTPPLAWKPDLFAKPKGRFPGLLGLVTFSGSETHSREKFWRNFAEYANAKLHYPTLCGVSILAGQRVRARILETQLHCFNRVIQLEELASPKSVARWITALTKRKSDQGDLFEAAEDLALSDRNFSLFVGTLSKELTAAIKSAAPLQPTFWSIVGRTSKRQPGSIRSTCFRRGIAKAVLFDDREIQMLQRENRLPDSPTLHGLVRAGVLVRSIRGLVVADEELHYALHSVDDLRAIVSENATDVGISVRERLRALSEFETALLWCREHWSLLRDEHLLAVALKRGKANWPPPPLLFSALKASLASLLGRQGQDWLQEVVETTGEMRSILVGLILPKFERDFETLTPELANAVAAALSSRVRAVSPLRAEKVSDALTSYVRHEIENRLICNGIDPVKALILRSLSSAGIPARAGRLPSGIAEALGYPDRDLGTSGLFAGRETFIHWKTVTDQGRDHKVKELYARIRHGIKQWRDGAYRDRRNPRLFFLVADGSWTAADFELLLTAGWTAVFYPDELDELVKAIV